MTESRLLVPDAELTPDEWLTRFALTRFKFGGEEKQRLLEIAELLRETSEVRDAMGALLEKLVNIVNGTPEPGSAWGWHDLAERVQLLKDGKPLPPTEDATVQ